MLLEDILSSQENNNICEADGTAVIFKKNKKQKFTRMFGIITKFLDTDKNKYGRDKKDNLTLKLVIIFQKYVIPVQQPCQYTSPQFNKAGRYQYLRVRVTWGTTGRNEQFDFFFFKNCQVCGNSANG